MLSNLVGEVLRHTPFPPHPCLLAEKTERPAVLAVLLYTLHVLRKRALFCIVVQFACLSCWLLDSDSVTPCQCAWGYKAAALTWHPCSITPR